MFVVEETSKKMHEISSEKVNEKIYSNDKKKAELDLLFNKASFTINT